MNRIWIRKDLNIKFKIFFSVFSVLLVLIVWIVLTTIRAPSRILSKSEYVTILSHIENESDREIFIRSYIKRKEKYKLKKVDNRDKLRLYNNLVSIGYLSMNPPKKLSESNVKKAIENSLNFVLDKNQVLRDKKIFFKIYQKKGNFYIRKLKVSKEEKISIFSILKNSGIIPQAKISNPIISMNVLAHPLDIIKAFPNLIKGSKNKFVWKKSLFFSIWISLKREVISFLLVLLFGLPIGIFMSTNTATRYFFLPFLIVGTFLPIAALIPLTMSFFGIGEIQKIIFLVLGMFFVLLGLIVKEMDEVDEIYLETGYTLGFSQIKTIFFINFPIALPRIWKHFSAVFGLGWGYIIFAEMINSGSSDMANGIGWLFLARRRRLEIPDMYAIFFVIIFLAFLFSYLFKLGSWVLFKSERETNKGEE